MILPAVCNSQFAVRSVSSAGWARGRYCAQPGARGRGAARCLRSFSAEIEPISGAGAGARARARARREMARRLSDAPPLRPVS